MLALPGSAYIYQGEELGLPEAIDLPDAAREDPTFFRTGGELYGRDGCRVPIPWEADAPASGFSPTGSSWLPQPATGRRTRATPRQGVPGSTLEFYRDALALRREHALGTGDDRVARVRRRRRARVPQRRGHRDREHRRRHGRAAGGHASCCAAATPATALLPGDTTVWIA